MLHPRLRGIFPPLSLTTFLKSSTAPGQMPSSPHRNSSFGTIRNEHTQRAYLHAVKRFLKWAEKHGGGELTQIAPWHVGQYFAELAKTTSIATRNQHLSALRHFFDGLVTRHAIALNPALSVRGERYSVMEGKTPEIP